MPIAKRPKRNTDAGGPADERAAEAFIGAAGKGEPEGAAGTRKAPVMLRFDRELLGRVDGAWMQFTVSRALDSGEG